MEFEEDSFRSRTDELNNNNNKPFLPSSSSLLGARIGDLVSVALLNETAEQYYANLDLLSLSASDAWWVGTALGARQGFTREYKPYSQSLGYYGTNRTKTTRQILTTLRQGREKQKERGEHTHKKKTKQ